MKHVIGIFVLIIGLCACPFAQAPLRVTASWDPPSVGSGSSVFTTVSDSRAQVNDVVSVSHDRLASVNVLLTAYVHTAGQVRVVLLNRNGATINVPLGTLTLLICQSGAPPPVNQPPTVNPTAVPSSGQAPLIVQFTANGVDPEGGPLSYVWNFGDGSSTSTINNPPHVYPSAGTFFASVTVTDNQGATKTSPLITIAATTAPPPPPPSTWSQPFTLTTGDALYNFVTASGNSIHAAFTSQGVLYYRRSTDEGTTWPTPFTQVAAGNLELYLERPIAIDGSTVVIASHVLTRDVSDWCCPRTLGNLQVNVSTDGGSSFRAPVQIGLDSYRVSMAIKGQQVVVTWDQFKDAFGTWDMMFRESTDGGLSWLPSRVLASASAAFGHIRPDILIDGTTVMVSWMKGIPTPCGPIRQCASLEFMRRMNGTWLASQQITPNDNYTGRPSMSITGNTLLMTFDTQLNNDAEVGLIRSTDRGVTWTAPTIWTRPGLDGHATVLAGRAGEFFVVWRGDKNGVRDFSYFRASTDGGVTFGPEELVLPDEAGVPAIGQTSNFLHVATSSPTIGPIKYSRRGWGAQPPPPGQAIAPTITPNGGTFTVAVSVTLATSTAGAAIRYTTAGATPSSTVGTLYTGPFSVAASGTIKAVAYKSGMTDSPVTTSAPFVINTAPPPPPSGACNWYASPAGTASGVGSQISPWDLQTALNKNTILGGQTLCLLGGTYKGKFTSTLVGTPSSPIVVRSAPGQWAILDAYVASTLSTAISGTQTTVTVTDASQFPVNGYLGIELNHDA